MKKWYFALGIAVTSSLLWTSCKEQIPSGLVLQSTVSLDTTYVSSTIDTPQAKVLLIEELTGATCTNCPGGTKMLKEFQDQNPGRVIVSALHSGFLTEPPGGAKYDFRNIDADALKLFFNEGDPGKPSATFDRVQPSSGNSAGKYFVLKGQTGSDWLAMVPARLSKTTPVNIYIESDYLPASNKGQVKIKLAFTQDYVGKMALSLFLLENGRIDKQSDKDLGVIPDYQFNHIFRKLISPVGGDLILDSLNTKVKGRVLEKTILFDMQTIGINGWNPDSCMIVAAVHRTGDSKEIIHAQEVHLKN